jgi:hypothetical protein
MEILITKGQHNINKNGMPQKPTDLKTSFHQQNSSKSFHKHPKLMFTPERSPEPCVNCCAFFDKIRRLLFKVKHNQKRNTYSISQMLILGTGLTSAEIAMKHGGKKEEEDDG